MNSPDKEQSSLPYPPQIPDSQDDQKWQRKLLPFTTRFLVGMVVIFFAFSMFNFYQMQNFLKDEAAGNNRLKIESIVKDQGKTQLANESADMVQHLLLVMEADVIDKRYRQANALLISRIWTRQLAFITGMVLAFVGAVFILSKVSQGRTDVSVSVKDWKNEISSSSPGLVLAFFGTVMMIVSLVVQQKIEVQDRPVYFTMMGLARNPNATSDQQQVRTPVETDPVDPFK